MMDVIALLDEFRRTRRDEAFRELARRHARLIYSVAKRRIRDCDQARDITQVVLTRLAQSPPEVRTSSELVGWLHRTTVHVAIDTWRSQARRQVREFQAATMPDPIPTSDSFGSALPPVVDEAVDQLPATDREVILLRYFGEKSMREIGESLGIAEDAAKMRIHRALERLRKFLVSRGITCTSAALGDWLADNTLESVALDGLEPLFTSETSVPSPRAPRILPNAPPGSSWLKGWGWGIPGATALLAGGIAFALLLLPSRNVKNTTSTPPNVAIDANPRITGTSATSAEMLFRRSRTPETHRSSPQNIRDQLRAILQRPPPAGSYPPKALTDAIGLFDQNLIEAVPILVEAAFSDDYEARAWAMSGISYLVGQLRRGGFPENHLQEALNQTASLFRKVLPNPDEPGLLRQWALETLVPRTIFRQGTAVGESSPLSPASLGILETTLSCPMPKLDPFRFALVDHLAVQWFNLGPFAETMVAAAARMVPSQREAERFVGAYAIARWPGPKSVAVREVLIAELKTRGTYSFNAATALGFLGAEALPHLPDLLEYAEAMRQLPNQGYTDRALEAACRLDPTLASRFPEAAQRLEQQQPTPEATLSIKPASLSDWILDTLKKPDGTNLLCAWLDHAGDPATARAELIRALQDRLPNAGGESRTTLEEQIARLQTLKAASETPPESLRKVTWNNLTLTARVLAIDQGESQEVNVQALLEKLSAEMPESSDEHPVTPESFQRFVEALRGMDPEFERSWRQNLRRDYPWLDRILPDAFR
ncbi:MAG: sigma-70 family RNA polymerase sigma factor [Verrucomicrobiales bacterium]|nr:sigma-70 family RNA polymerase sigma factor [Verrucomicrobiales bacterium]